MPFDPRHNEGAIGESVIRWPRVLTHIETPLERTTREAWVRGRLKSNPPPAPVAIQITADVEPPTTKPLSAEEAIRELQEWNRNREK